MHSSDNTLVIGIDIGYSGAVGIVSLEGTTQAVYDMPVQTVQSIKKGKTKNKNYLDEHEILSMISEFCSRGVFDKVVFFVEKQLTMPGMKGAMAHIEQGKQYGAIRMLVRCVQFFMEKHYTVKISIEELTAKEWQAHFRIGKDTKGDSVRIAEGLFPNISFRGGRGGAKDGRADAMLIAEYGRRRLQGEVMKRPSAPKPKKVNIEIPEEFLPPKTESTVVRRRR